MIDESFVWIVNWYSSQSDWKERKGIQISTIDNPGWSLKVDLIGTNLQNKMFQKIRIDRTENDWIRSFIEDGIFEGVGGPFNLPEILKIFCDWTVADQ